MASVCVSASGESEAKRNAAAEPQTEAAANPCAEKVILVTNGREVQQTGRGRKGDRGTTNVTVGETQRPLVTAMDDQFRNVLAVSW